MSYDVCKIKSYCHVVNISIMPKDEYAKRQICQKTNMPKDEYAKCSRRLMGTRESWLNRS